MLDDALLWTEVREGGKDVVALATFHTIILYERGLIRLPDVPLAPLPPDANEILRHVYHELQLLVRCRFAVYPNAPFPLTRRFVSAWCDVTPRQARRYVDLLEALDIFYRVGIKDAGEKNRMVLWMPTGYVVPEGWWWPGVTLSRSAARFGRNRRAFACGFLPMRRAFTCRYPVQNQLRTYLGPCPCRDAPPFVLLPAILHRAVERVVAELDAKKGKEREDAATAFLGMYRRDLQEHRLPLVNVKTARTLYRRLGEYLAAVTADDRLAA